MQYDYVTTQYAPSQPLYKGTQIVWFVFYIIETILLFRFFLLLIGANAAAPFMRFIYTLSAPFVDPFRAVVSPTYLGPGAWEWSTLIALLVYWVVTYAIVQLLMVSMPNHTTTVYRRLERRNVVHNI